MVGTANELDEHGSTTTFYRVRSTEAGATSSSLKTYLDFKRLHGALLDESSSHTPEPLPPCEQPLQTLDALDEYVRALSLDSVALQAFLQPPGDVVPACGPTARPRTAQPSSSQGTTAARAPTRPGHLPPPLSLLPPLLPLLAKQLASEAEGEGLLLCMCTAREAAASGRHRSSLGWMSQPLDASVPCTHLAHPRTLYLASPRPLHMHAHPLHMHPWPSHAHRPGGGGDATDCACKPAREACRPVGARGQRPA